MIRVTYRNKLKQPADYDADDFSLKENYPFVKSGLYIYKGDELVAFLNNLSDIEKVERIESVFRNA